MGQSIFRVSESEKVFGMDMNEYLVEKESRIMGHGKHWRNSISIGNQYAIWRTRFPLTCL